jgi:hypothetical protein
MAYENINVRMTRSNQSIQWGFQLRQQGNALAISFVQADSMADKAGVQIGDTVEQIFGTKPQNINDAQQKIQNSNEVSMNLKRFVANPIPHLPWTLEGKGNQIVVNHFDKNGRVSGVSDQNTAGYQNSFQSTQSLGGAPFSEEIRKITNIKKTETREGPAHLISNSNNENLPFSNTVKSESHSNWDQDEGNIKKHYETNRTYTRTESSNISPAGGAGGQQQSVAAAPFSHGTNQSSNFSSANNWQQQQSGGGQGGGNSGQYSNVQWYQNAGTGEWNPNHKNSSWNQNQQNWNQSNTQSSANWGQGNNQSWGQGGGQGGQGQYGSGSNAPWSGAQSQNQYGSSGGNGQGKHVTMVKTPQSGQYHGQDTGYPGSQGNYRNKSTTPNRGQSTTPTHYDGPRAYYSRSPRTVRELSPHATVAHLQYNSPLGMYSPEAAAEAYKMQTGQDLPIDGDYPRDNRPAYLNSATRRLIAEQEQGIRHRSPTPQSSALKRIAHAVGAD